MNGVTSAWHWFAMSLRGPWGFGRLRTANGSCPTFRAETKGARAMASVGPVRVLFASATDPEIGTHAEIGTQREPSPDDLGPKPHTQPRPDSASSDDDCPAFRALVEIVLCVVMAFIMLREFVVEGFIVPSGSMAPALYGHYRHLSDETGTWAIDMGAGPESPTPRAIPHPADPQARIDPNQFPISSGDRLLVQKGVFDYRPPRRWEMVVFSTPDEPRQAFVKRVVGLPGETIFVQDGDVYIDGKIARKTLAEYRQMAMPVTSLDQGDLSARWMPDEEGPSNWRVEGNRLLASPLPQTATGGAKTSARLSYRHRDDRGDLAPVRDQTPYNPPRPVWLENAVTDMLLEATIDFAPEGPRAGATSQLTVAYQVREDFPVEWRLRPDFTARSLSLEVWGNGEKLAATTLPMTDSLSAAKPILLAVGMLDGALVTEINGREPLGVIAVPAPPWEHKPTTTSPFALEGENVQLTDVSITRDIFYLAQRGSNEPVQLSDEGYYMLGDNSTVSQDSRAWADPEVPRRLLIGKPIFVFWPSQVWEIAILGQRFQVTLPDFARMRSLP